MLIVLSLFLISTIAVPWLDKIMATIIFTVGAIVMAIIVSLLESSKRNMNFMLNNYYKPYSENRMNKVIELLKKYKIDVNDKEKIECLVDQAKMNKEKSDFFRDLVKMIKSITKLVVPILTFIAGKISDEASSEEVLTLAAGCIVIIICVCMLSVILEPVVKKIMQGGLYKYDELIADLNQIKIFYSKG